uniref:Uncharacterized protein n=1 Tax=Timema douglasi TaxID=61478 RepID=A0A7R8ZFZ1_TIMDO|nr:unnamed protein product [Timema douglasi]
MAVRLLASVICVLVAVIAHGAANVNCQIQPILSRFPLKVSGNLVSTNYKYSLQFSGSGFRCNLVSWDFINCVSISPFQTQNMD